METSLGEFDTYFYLTNKSVSMVTKEKFLTFWQITSWYLDQYTRTHSPISYQTK